MHAIPRVLTLILGPRMPVQESCRVTCQRHSRQSCVEPTCFAEVPRGSHANWALQHHLRRQSKPNEYCLLVQTSCGAERNPQTSLSESRARPANLFIELIRFNLSSGSSAVSSCPLVTSKLPPPPHTSRARKPLAPRRTPNPLDLYYLRYEWQAHVTAPRTTHLGVNNHICYLAY